MLGASDKNKIVGVESSSKFLEELSNRIVNKLSIYPDINTLDVDDKGGFDN